MATAEFSLMNNGSTTPANWESWRQAVKTQLLAVGLIRMDTTTEDTGQLTAAITVWVNSANNVYGYDMFRLPVTGQDPLYVKVEYMGGASPTYTQLRFSVGSRWVSNGTLSVNLTGSTVAPTAVSLMVNSSDSTTRNCWMSCDPAGGFAFVHAYDSNSNAKALYIIDSYRTTAGAADTSGFSVMRTNTGSTNVIINVDPANGAQSNASRWPCLTRGGNPASVRDASGETTLFPTCQSNTQGSSVSMMSVGYNINDIPGTTIFSAPHLGATRTFRARPEFPGSSIYNESTISSAILWE